MSVLRYEVLFARGLFLSLALHRTVYCTQTCKWSLPLAEMTVAINTGWCSKFACQASKGLLQLQHFWISFQNTFDVCQDTTDTY